MRTPHSVRAWTGAGALLALALGCGQDQLPTGASAPNLVTATPDIVVSTTGDDGPGSLRQAVLDAADGDVIGFDPGLAGARILLADRILIQGKAVTIEGSADRGIILDGDGLTGIFFVNPFAGLTLRNATVTGGTSATGAIAAAGTVRIENSTIAGNRSISQGSAGDGYGGGISHLLGSLTIVNSTISGNTAEQAGGGIGSGALAGSITLIHSTVTGNDAPDDVGGGIFLADADIVLTLQNTIVAGNTAETSHNCFLQPGQAISYLGINLLGDAACRPRTEDIVASDPVVGSLADNGGPTPTRALLAGSPAIETATQACSTVTTDQRYLARPQGDFCDIGAFEFDGFVTPPLAIDAGGTVNPNTGVAFVSGRVTCPAPATLTIEAKLRQTQKIARVNTVIEATAQTQVTCGGTKAWSVALTPASGAFRSGSGTVTAKTVSGPNYLKTAEATRTVKLAWARK